MGAKMHDRYGQIKNTTGKADYSNFTTDPKETEVIASVLGTTLGIPIFQEQLMALAGVVAGFSASGREKVRKAVSKKIEEVMRQVGEEFMKGAMSDHDQDGRPKLAFCEQTAQRLWDAIKGAGAYAFNASHAVGYAQLGWQTAYLRANFPAETAAGLLSVDTDRNGSSLSAIRQVMRDGITVRCPDVNVSEAEPTVVYGEVFLGFGSIKSLKGVVAQQIIAERENRPFTSAVNFCARTNMSRSDLLYIIEAGALDRFGKRKGLTVLANTLVGAAIDDEPGPMINAMWSPQEVAWREGERLGVILTVDLMKEKQHIIKEEMETARNPVPIRRIAELDMDEFRIISTAGVITRVEVFTKNKRRVNLELVGSGSAVLSCVIWDSSLEKLFGDEDPKEQLRVGDLVAVSGKPSMYTPVQSEDDETPPEAVPQLSIYELDFLE